MFFFLRYFIGIKLLLPSSSDRQLLYVSSILAVSSTRFYSLLKLAIFVTACFIKLSDQCSYHKTILISPHLFSPVQSLCETIHFWIFDPLQILSIPCIRLRFVLLCFRMTYIYKYFQISICPFIKFSFQCLHTLSRFFLTTFSLYRRNLLRAKEFQSSK